MKKEEKKEQNFIDLIKKPFIIVVIMLTLQFSSYLIIKLFQSNYHLLATNFDSKIPFNEYFSIIYVSWYAMLLFIPLFIYTKNKTKFVKYIITYSTIILISLIIFVIYPTEVLRPELTGNNILVKFTELLYLIDTPAINCLPSVHCAMSMLFILSTIKLENTKIIIKILIFIEAILIMLSTLFIKQHILLDLVIGDLITLAVFLAVSQEKRITNKVKKLLKI